MWNALSLARKRTDSLAVFAVPILVATYSLSVVHDQYASMKFQRVDEKAMRRITECVCLGETDRILNALNFTSWPVINFVLKNRVDLYSPVNVG